MDTLSLQGRILRQYVSPKRLFSLSYTRCRLWNHEKSFHPSELNYFHCHCLHCIPAGWEIILTLSEWAAISQSVWRLATSWTVRGSNSAEGENFRTCPDGLWGPPNLLYGGYCISLPGVKRPRRGAYHPPPPSAKVKERLELYFHFPSGHSRPVLGWTLSLPLPKVTSPRGP